jgi:hypothetical protein
MGAKVQVLYDRSLPTVCDISRIVPASIHLLILDDVHNLAPSSVGDYSELSKMLQQIAPWFEIGRAHV